MVGYSLAILAIFTLLVSQSHAWDWAEQGDDWTDVCATGKSQSPIDIITADFVSVDSDDDTVKVVTSFKDFTGNFVLSLGSPTYHDETNGVGTLKINSDEFNLVDVHFHSPAEHLINGVRPAFELHLYGLTKDGKNLETAILFKIGEENDFIQSIIESVGNTKTTKFNLGSIYPKGTLDDYYYYIGSTSAPFPDCIEGTSWVILDKYLEISPEQLTYFQQVWTTWEKSQNYESEGRYRHVQPLNGRKVYHYQDDDDDDSAFNLALSFLLLAFLI